MSNRYKWFNGVNSRKMLLRFEKSMKVRTERYRALNEKLFEFFQQKRSQNAPIGDQDLRRWAFKLNKKLENRIENFKAGKRWLENFKKSRRVVSRKITKFVTKRHSTDNEKIQNAASTFVTETKLLITERVPDLVLNTDQFGFVLELHRTRSLEIEGTKIVKELAQTISGTTHFYTICPIISSSGELFSPMLMVLAERNGVFPPTIQVFKAENIVAVAGRSHIMTKVHAEIFCKEILKRNIGDRKTVLLVDAWPTWRNALKMANIGDNLEVKEIPAGCTGLVQPCDLYLFRQWKELVRRFSDRVVLDDLQVKLHQRDQLIRLQSLIHNQLSAERFRTYLKYSWFKGGYLDENEDAFKNFNHPVKFCFPYKTPDLCSFIGCDNSVLIRCAHCEMFLCYECFYAKNPYHYH